MSIPAVDSITVPRRFQGPTGQGQGGWTAGRLSALLGRPVQVRFRTPIPLDVALTVEGSGHGWRCCHDDTVVLEAFPWEPDDLPATDPVAIDDAAAARGRFPVPFEHHPLPFCFSCGVQPDTMGVHPGPLAGRPQFATDWTVPVWADVDGAVDPAVVWAALDCASGVFTGFVPEFRMAFTGELAVHIRRPLVAGERIAVVAWDPGDPGGWQGGRTRRTAAQAFDASGTTVAQAVSTWVAVPAAALADDSGSIVTDANSGVIHC